MGQRSRVSPFQVRGPWRGLDTSRSPRELGPQDAAIADNVIFRDGAITPRPPFIIESGPTIGQKIHAGAQFMLQQTDLAGRNLRIIHLDDRLQGDLADPISGVNRRPGTFLSALGRLYYLDGVRGYVLRQDGVYRAWTRLGLPVPTFVNHGVSPFVTTPQPGSVLVRFSTDTTPPSDPAALMLAEITYEFSFTLYDSVTDTESNGSPILTFTNPQSTPGAHMEVKAGASPPMRSATTLRIYRRNVTAAEVASVLYAEAALDPGSVYYVVGAPLGNPEVGPFVPVKNGLHENASIGLFYKGRMLYNDLLNPNRLRFSADSHPAHVHPLDYLELDDDGSQITGMVEYAGQAVILKERSIWILSGVLIAPTNASIALGASVVPSAHDLYRTRAAPGCANAAGGNGAIVCGSPARVYYNAVEGFYAFDGIDAAPVSSRIQPTWKQHFALATQGPNQAISYYDDKKRRVLYMFNQSPFETSAPILAYHYEVGAWSTLSVSPYAFDNTQCLLPYVGSRFFTGTDPLTQDVDYRSEELYPIGLAAAVGRATPIPEGYLHDVFVFVMSERQVNLPMPEFIYQTGPLNVVDGVDKHFYAVKWFHGQALVDDGLDHGVTVGYQTGIKGTLQIKNIGFTRDSSTYHAVSETGQDIALSVRGSSNQQWSPDVRIVGFEIDAEIVGQR